MKILIALTSHDRLGDTGNKTGFWYEEFATPYYIFKDAGAEIVLASPKGGRPPLDPRSEAPDRQTDATRRFSADPAAMAQLAETVELGQIEPADIDALFFPGGHGPVWDLAEDKAAIALIETMAAAGKPVGAVCHGVAVFRHPKSAKGAPLVHGRKVAGFSNSEEAAIGLTDVVPYLVEDVLKANGGLYQRGEDWAACVAVDGNLVTGQNPASSGGVAHHMLALLDAAALRP